MKAAAYLACLGVAIVVMSTSCQAQGAAGWIRYESNETAEAFIRPQGGNTEIRRYEAMVSFRTPAGRMQSSVNQAEMNCTKRQWRLLRSTSYSGQYGQGEIVGVISAESWASAAGVPPGGFTALTGAGVQHYTLLCGR